MENLWNATTVSSHTALPILRLKPCLSNLISNSHSQLRKSVTLTHVNISICISVNKTNVCYRQCVYIHSRKTRVNIKLSSKLLFASFDKAKSRYLNHVM